MILALGSALFGMVAYGAASVLQAVGAARASGPAVVRQPAYLLGLAADGVAWLASLVALRQMPVFAVQALLAGSVGVTVVLAWVFLGARPRPRDTAAIAVLTAALVGVSVSSGVQGAQGAPGWFTWAAWAGAVLSGALLLLTYRNGRSASLAVVAGAAFAGAAVCARGLESAADILDLPLQPLAWAVVAFGLVGALGYARSLERGDVGPATALLWVVEVLLAGGVGVVFLGDGVRPGLGWLAALSVLAAVAASAVLALSPSAEPHLSAQDTEPDRDHA